MKLITITKILYLKDHLLEISFSDTCTKIFDFSQLIDFKGITEQLKDKDYFKTVSILEGGRAFGWDNEYDCCVDWARYYAKDVNNEWENVSDTTTLKQRMTMSIQKMKRTTL